MAAKLLRVSSYTRGVIGPSIPMLGPLEDGGTIIAQTPPGCWGPMITPHFKGGHEVTQPVWVEGARLGDAIAIKIKGVRLKSKATSSGTAETIEGRRFTDGALVVTRCPQCHIENPATILNGIGPQAIRCRNCGAVAIPFRMTCGYTIVFDDDATIGITVGKEKAEEIAQKSVQYAALPENSEQHPVLSLANADLPGILARVRPFVGNIGTVPAMDVSDSRNCGDLARFLHPSEGAAIRQEQIDLLTDAHMDIDSVREKSILICPVKVEGGGIYLGDVHAMQGDGEIAGHTTDVSAEVTLEVEVVKGLAMKGPLLLPPLEDLPFLARPFSTAELDRGHRLASEWGVELENAAPIQVIGSGQDLNAAVRNGLERTAALLGMSLDEVRNRATINGSIEIGRTGGVVTVTLLTPTSGLERLGILHLVKEQYSLQ